MLSRWCELYAIESLFNAELTCKSQLALSIQEMISAELERHVLYRSIQARDLQRQFAIPRPIDMFVSA